MSDARRTKADLIAELDALRARVADLSAAAEVAASTRTGLQRLETRYGRALQDARAMIAEVDEKGFLTYVSPTLSQVLGYQPEEVLNRSGFEWVHEEDRREIEELYRQQLASDRSGRIVYRARHKAGHWVWLETTGTVHQASDGSTYSIAFTRDISELKQAEEALRESEMRHRQLAENASDLIAEVDGKGLLLYVSPNCRSLLGYEAEDLVGETFRESVLATGLPRGDLSSLAEAFARILESPDGGAFECRFRHRDGRWRWFECSARSYRNGEGALRGVVIARDVTQRVKAEQELREGEERFRLLAEATHELVVEFDSEGRVVYRNPNSVALLGDPPGSLVGTSPFARIHPDEVERAVSLFLERIKTVGPLPVEVFRCQHQDGSYRLIEFGGVNYKTPDGEIRMVLVAQDVTETRRLQQERGELEQRMQQIQKLEGLGVLAGGIAHDFNNLLTPILGDASLALMELPSESPVCTRLEKIKKAAHRAAALTGQMLAYSGTESLQVEVLDLSRIVREMSQLVESAASRKAILEYDLADDLYAVEGDAAQLSQVLMNLVTNASEALGEGTGRIAIRTGTVEADRAYLSRTFPGGDLREGTYVYLEVADTGCGIDADTRQRIFDPFFTTKFTGRGLGLAAVLGIVRGHGGAVEIESEPGRGARFRALFPARECPLSRSSPKPPPPAEWRGSGTLLVADDDEDVLEYAAETLERAGLRVLRASDGSEAVETFRRHADEIGAVFLDRTMPLKSGGEAFEEIRRIRPDARIVLVSGYSEASVRERFAGRDLTGFLHKPYPPAALLRKAREALES